MFFTFKDCKNKENKNFKNVLHIGAHLGEEIEEYYNFGVESICWFEAIPFLEKKLKENTSKFPIKQKYFFYGLSDIENKDVKFNITNNGQSSSLLDLGTHLQYCPDINVTQTINIQTKRLDDFEKEIDFSIIDLIVLDVQGAELKVLNGFGNLFDKYKNIQGIFTEINFEEVYVGCPKVEQLDELLEKFNFKRTLTHRFVNPWGDAFYLRG